MDIVLYGKLVGRVSVPAVNAKGEFFERLQTVVICPSCTMELASEIRAEIEARGKQGKGEWFKWEWFEWVAFPISV